MLDLNTVNYLSGSGHLRWRLACRASGPWLAPCTARKSATDKSSHAHLLLCTATLLHARYKQNEARFALGGMPLKLAVLAECFHSAWRLSKPALVASRRMKKAAYVNRAQLLPSGLHSGRAVSQLAIGMHCLLLGAAGSRVTCQQHRPTVAATGSLAERRNRRIGLRSTSQKASREAQTLALRGVRRLPADPSAVPALRVDILDASSVCKPCSLVSRNATERPSAARDSKLTPRACAAFHPNDNGSLSLQEARRRGWPAPLGPEGLSLGKEVPPIRLPGVHSS